MALSDRGHPSVSSSGPTVLIVIKEKSGEEGDDTNSNVSAGPPDPRPPDDRVGPPLSSTGSCDKRSRGSHFSSRDFVCRTECHSALERGSRLVETRLLFRSQQISDPIRRTGLPSQLPSRSMAGYKGYTPNLHSARKEAMSKSQPAESGKES